MVNVHKRKLRQDFLEQMIDELQFNGEKENSPDECIYYGVEVGKPTVESIEN